MFSVSNHNHILDPAKTKNMISKKLKWSLLFFLNLWKATRQLPQWPWNLNGHARESSAKCSGTWRNKVHCWKYRRTQFLTLSKKDLLCSFLVCSCNLLKKNKMFLEFSSGQTVKQNDLLIEKVSAHSTFLDQTKSFYSWTEIVVHRTQCKIHLE